ncbi:MAG: phosphoribosylanthranilate isomerase [Oscillospiraceae bacterium]|jgi:phosphoribosylanthranilate isomerase|nr:phosphoribosylanthranilate isomerase [Oscillospiraceae bacterium]MDD3261746.1 phosphoribosylanthranilate isomerase [Oscillospiraceae bacterium]
MTRIKICGLSRMEDIAAVNAARPEYAGFVFAESRRQVTPQQAARLRGALAPGIIPIGVFVNAQKESVLRLFLAGTIAAAQLHGSEEESDIRFLQQAGVPVIRAFRVKSAQDALHALQSPADCLLLDSGSGTGKTFDWSVLPPIARPWFLAGGLTPENVCHAVQTLHPWGVDVSSGVETDGKKDSVKIDTIIRRVRNG